MEEADAKLAADLAKAKKMEEKVELKRKKLKMKEDAKIRDILRKSSQNKPEALEEKTESAVSGACDNTEALDSESDDSDDDSSSEEAAQYPAEYLSATRDDSKVFAEPFQGSAGTVVVEGTSDAFMISETEALLDFTEVTRKRIKSVSNSAPAVKESGKKRGRSNTRNSGSPVGNGATVPKKDPPITKDPPQQAPMVVTTQVSLEL